jgi:hypothetical protein
MDSAFPMRYELTQVTMTLTAADLIMDDALHHFLV